MVFMWSVDPAELGERVPRLGLNLIQPKPRIFTTSARVLRNYSLNFQFLSLFCVRAGPAVTEPWLEMPCSTLLPPFSPGLGGVCL